MENLERRIRTVIDKKETAKTRVAQLEGERLQLDKQKDQIIDKYKELGISPKAAPKELEKLEQAITSKLEEAEKIIEEAEATDD